jgi:hypothetical protein
MVSRGGAGEEKKLMDGWCLDKDIMHLQISYLSERTEAVNQPPLLVFYSSMFYHIVLSFSSICDACYVSIFQALLFRFRCMVL